MEAFFQGLQTNSSVLLVQFAMFVMILKQNHKLDMWIKEFSNRADTHDSDHKGTKKRVLKLEEKVDVLEKKVK